MKLYLLLCLIIGTVSAQIYQYEPVQTPYAGYPFIVPRIPFGYRPLQYSPVQYPEADDNVQQFEEPTDFIAPVPGHGLFSGQQPVLRLGEDMASTSSEEDVNETPAVVATPTTTPSPQVTLAQLMKDKMLMDTVAKITKLKEDYKKKHSDLVLSYQMKLNDLNTKYQLKYAQMLAVNPDETSPAYSLLKLQTQVKTDDLKQKYKLKEADMISKYKLKLNTLAQQLALLSPPKTTSDTNTEDLELNEEYQPDLSGGENEQTVLPRLKLGFTGQQPVLGLGEDMASTTSEEGANETPAAVATTQSPQAALAQLMKDKMLMDTVAKITKLKEDFKKKHSDLVLSYQTKLNDLNTKYQLKYAQMLATNPDETSPAYNLLKLQTQMKIDDLKQKYQLKEADMISKYKLKLNTLAQQVALLSPPKTTSDTNAEDSELTEEYQPDLSDEENEQTVLPRLKLGAGVPSSSEEVTTKKPKEKKKKTKKEKTDSKKTIDPAEQIELLKEEYKKKHDDLITSYEAKLNDIKMKYQTKSESLPEFTPEGEENPILLKLKTDTKKKIDDLKQKYQLKEQDLIAKYKTKIDPLVQELESQQKVEEPTSEKSSEVSQESEETQNLIPMYQQNEDLTQQTQYPQYVQPQYPQNENLMPKPQYPTRPQYPIPPQYPQGRDMVAQQPQEPQYPVNPPQYVQPPQYPQSEDYLPQQPQQNEDFQHPYTPYFNEIQQQVDSAQPKLVFQHTGDIVHPPLKLSADPSDDQTLDESPSAVTSAPTYPPLVPPIFWMNFGKMIGKAFAAAKFNMLSSMFSTTPAPVNPLNPTAVPATPNLDTAFIDEFGKQLQNVIAAKAYMASLKPTTPLPTEVNIDEEGLFEPVIPKLKLRSTGKATDTISTTPTLPGLYWKTFGDKIKESFNKSKTATDSPVDATPLPPTYWMNFGKAIGKALSDAKVQIVTASKPTTMSPVASGDAKSTVTPVPPLDDTFWEHFGQQLDTVLNPKAATTEATTQDTSLQPQETDKNDVFGENTLQTRDDNIMYQKPKLYLSPPTSSTPPLYVVPLTKTPVAPVYWKTYDQPMTAPVTPGSGMVVITPTPPGLYWKSYGDQLAGHFINAKGQILDTVSKIKPTFFPFFIPPYNPMSQAMQQSENLPQQQPGNWNQQDLQQPTQDWGQNLNYEQDVNDYDLPQSSLKKRKLYMSAGSADDDTLTGPGLYWKSYGQSFKNYFQDAKEKTKQDVAQAKTQQPIYNVDEVDPTTLPEKQATFWSTFSQRIKDNYSKAKAKIAEFAG